MFLAFGKAMAHKHNKDADGSSNSPMSGHYSCEAITGVWWMVCHARREFTARFTKGNTAGLTKGQTEMTDKVMTPC